MHGRSSSFRLPENLRVLDQIQHYSRGWIRQSAQQESLPAAENPLRVLPSLSWSTRKTVMSALVCALDMPSDRGKMTSMWTRAFAGGQVAVKTKAPSALKSRVAPSPWKRLLSGPFQWKITAVFMRYRLALLLSVVSVGGCVM
jgi:hypothetical protein